MPKKEKCIGFSLYFRKMKIGYDAKRLFCNVTGLGNYSRSLLRNLSHYEPNNEYNLFTPEARRSHLTEDFFETPAYTIHEATASLKSYWRSFSIVKDLKRGGIELFHGLSNELPFRLRQNEIKSVVTIHDLIFKIYPETYSLAERIVYDKKFRYACHNADKIISISENTKQDIIRFYNIEASKIEVVYQACHPSFYTLRSSNENEAVQAFYQLPTQYFLYVGSVEKRKNLQLIIEAYREKSNEICIPILIIGKGGEYKNFCKKLIRQYGLEQYFIWQERLESNSDLQSIFQCATAIIYPSFYEGFGLPIAEALLCKTPVITALTSSLQEAGGANSLYIDPNDAASLFAAMMRILNDPNLADTMREKGFEYAHKNFGPKRLSQQLTAIYEAVFMKFSTNP